MSEIAITVDSDDDEVVNPFVQQPLGKPGNPFTKEAEKPKTKFDKVKEALDETKEATNIAIDKAIKRGDELQPLLEKTEGLSLLSFNFKKKSHQLKKQMWCDNLQKKGCLIVAILLIITIIVLIIVYSTKKH